MRAVEAAERSIFEIRCMGETTRFAILNRAHLEMADQFPADMIDGSDIFSNFRVIRSQPLKVVIEMREIDERQRRPVPVAAAGKAPAPWQAPQMAPVIAAIVSQSPPREAATRQASQGSPGMAAATANAAGTDS